MVKLVVIDAKNFTYSVYNDRKRIEKLQSDVHLSAEFVEYLRTNTEQVSKTITEREPA